MDETNTLEAGPVSIPLSEIDVSYARSGGPGGQHVNKTETKAVVRFNLVSSPSVPEELRALAMERLASRLTTDGDIIVTSSKSRSQSMNTDDAMGRLSVMLDEAFTPDRPRKKTRPSRSQRERRLQEKKQNSQKKQQRGMRFED